MRYPVRLAMRIFFRRIYLINQNKALDSEAIIYACTHPNSFLDDTLMATMSNRPLNFLARGDVFKKSWSRVILKIFNIHPIYRASEFKNDLDKNDESFAFSRTILSNKGVIIIHPEGICVHEKRVRKLRKGIGRIAFGAEDENKWNLDLKIVPVALNYTDAPKEGEDVMIVFGAPISLETYRALHQANAPKALLELNNEIRASLLKNTIVIQDPNNDDTINCGLLIGRNNFKNKPSFRVSADRSQLDMEQRIANHLNRMAENDAHAFKELTHQVDTYFHKLTLHKISDLSLSKSSSERSFLNFGLFWLKNVFLLIGYCVNILPYVWVKKFVAKKVKLIEFKASVLFTLSLLIFGILYSIILIASIILLGWWGLILFIIVAFTAVQTPKNLRNWNHFRSSFRLSKLKRSQPKEHQDLVRLRHKISAQLSE